MGKEELAAETTNIRNHSNRKDVNYSPHLSEKKASQNLDCLAINLPISSDTSIRQKRSYPPSEVHKALGA